MLRRALIISSVSIAAACSLPASAQTKLLANIFLPPGHFSQKVFRDWAADVEKASGNSIKIEFTAGNLAPPPQQMSAAASGIFDIGLVANQFIKAKAPLVQFSSLPWMVDDPEKASVALWRTYEKHFASKNQYPDVHLLGLLHFTGGNLYSLNDKPIDSMDELKKRKLWALPGPAADLLKSVGISPVTSPAVQISESVSRGVVEGHIGLAEESVTDFKVGPYSKTMTQFPRGVTSTSFSVFMNKAKWDSLNAKQKEAFNQASGAALAERLGKVARQATVEANNELKAAGMKTIKVNPAFYAELKKATEPQYQQMNEAFNKAGLDPRTVLQDFEKEMAR